PIRPLGFHRRPRRPMPAILVVRQACPMHRLRESLEAYRIPMEDRRQEAMALRPLQHTDGARTECRSYRKTQSEGRADVPTPNAGSGGRRPRTSRLSLVVRRTRGGPDAVCGVRVAEPHEASL